MIMAALFVSTLVSKAGADLETPFQCGSEFLAKGGFRRITLPEDMAEGCDIWVINADSASGKRLIGFPSTVNPRLYPGQAVSVVRRDGRWFAKSTPGRWRINGPQTVRVDALGDDENDGLSDDTPLRTIGAAAQVIQRDFDLQQATPIIAVSVGQEFTDPLLLGGQATGGNLVQISPYGRGSFTWTTPGPCIVVGDNAEIDVRLNQFSATSSIRFQCNRSHARDSGHIFVHNNGVLDMEGTPVFVGAGKYDNAIYFDGPTAGAALMDGFLVDGEFDSLLRMEEGGGRFRIHGSIAPVSRPEGTWYPWRVSEQPRVGRMVSIHGASQLYLNGDPQLTGWGSIGTSIVSGQALLVTNGRRIPGGAKATQNGLIADSKR
uniref:hypothetical protein n=1 Tax=Bradyrhizobium sp. (strain ORS 278) TaxID=114615 RepID=UPI0005A0B755|nr:hypothetical protein [Bradyrhizobium sp. ORS 278]